MFCFLCLSLTVFSTVFKILNYLRLLSLAVSQNNGDMEYMVSHSSSCIAAKQNHQLFKPENHYIQSSASIIIPALIFYDDRYLTDTGHCHSSFFFLVCQMGENVLWTGFGVWVSVFVLGGVFLFWLVVLFLVLVFF